MKKVMIGILILIPIIVLLVVVLVGAVISMDAYIEVESISIVDADGNAVKNLTVNASELDNGIFDILHFATPEVLPEKATNKQIQWTLDELVVLDEEYRQNYEYYIEHKDDHNVREVKPAAMLIDEKGLPVDSNTTGKIEIRTYCSFRLKASAGMYVATINVYVAGFDVEKVSLSIVNAGSDAFVVGTSRRIEATYTPIDSIVNAVEWISDKPSIATVDQNGVVTAVGVGIAHITHRASVYSSGKENPQFVESAPLEVVVVGGVSEIYGNSLTTSSNSISLNSLGLPSGFVVVGEGGTIEDGVLTITGDQVVLSNGNQQFTINHCASDDIVIANAEFFDHNNESNNFILESDEEKPFVLSAKWADQTRDGKPTDVVWTSSNTNIATVSENGEVVAKGSGIVVITARYQASEVSISLNIREKITSIRLETGIYEVGYARETVFASQRFVDVEVDDTLEANSTLLHIVGEPEEEEQLLDFYSAYNFEIVEGQAFASFDSTVPNKLVFNSAGLEGKGRKQILVRVSAKYPKYETMPHYTTKEITLNAVYGIEINSAIELKHATLIQKNYAYANKVMTKNVTPAFIPKNVDGVNVYDENSEYVFFDTYQSSSKYLAIAFGSDIPIDATYLAVYGADAIVNEKAVKVLCDDSRFNLYGSVYGNGHTISTTKDLYNQDDGESKYLEIFHVSWDDVTISNMRIIPNTLGEDESQFSNDDTKGLWGDCVDVEIIEDEETKTIYGMNHLRNVVIEYCLLQNGLKVSSVYNADVTYSSCVIKNVAQCGFYTPTRFRTIVVDEQEYMLPEYTHFYWHNIVASNMLGTLSSITYDWFALQDTGVYRFNQTEATIDAFMNRVFVANGWNAEVHQTGFLDLYNWQSSSQVNMLDTGDSTTNSLIQSAMKTLIDKHPDLEKFKVRYKNEKGVEDDYFHMGFICVGLGNSGADGGIGYDERTYIVFDNEDTRLGLMRSKDLTPMGGLSGLFCSLEVNIYLYDNTQEDILPSTLVPDGEALVNHLHE